MNILGKPWYRSFTVWGLLIFVGASGAVDQVCSAGLLSPEHCTLVQEILQKVGGVLTVLGIRRAKETAT